MRKNKIAFKIMADTNFDQISDPGNDNSITGNVPAINFFKTY